MTISNILLLFGGLGFFLYGMKLMSDGLEKVAGSKMRKVLELCTKNRFVGLVVGFLFTAVIQSSSATTVMVVSFVNSGLISLGQAVGPILGANIGTTVTGLLVAMNLEVIAPVFIIAGVIMVSFCKKPFVQKLGDVILGFGVLFYGMDVMKGSMSTLKDSPKVIHALGTLTNPFLAVLAGFVITTILQSSSASTGILIGMASQGLLGLRVSMFLILGCNIGTCTSAMIACIGGKKDAKRTAWVHMMFNVISTILTMCILIPFGHPIADTILKFANYDQAKGVADANVILKIVQVVVMFPVMSYVVKLTYKLVRGEDKKATRFELKYIGPTSTTTPATVILDVTKEIRRLGRIANGNLRLASEVLVEPQEEKIKKVFEVEEQIDFLSRAITDYLVDVSQSSIPLEEAKNIAAYFHVVNDFERIGDHAENLAEFAQSRIDQDISFSEKGIEGLQEMTSKVIATVTYAIEIFAEENEEHLVEIVKLEDEIDHLEDKLQSEHIKRMAKNECSPRSAIYSDILSNLERVSDHATNIAFAIHKQDLALIEGELTKKQETHEIQN